MLNVISVRQPFAEMLVSGLKLHEFRSWSVAPGWYCVHASGSKPFRLSSDEVYETGCICGAIYIDSTVETKSLPLSIMQDDALVDTAREAKQVSQDHPIAWHISDSLSIDAPDRYKCKGKQRIWQVDENSDPVLKLLKIEMSRDRAEEAC